MGPDEAMLISQKTYIVSRDGKSNADNQVFSSGRAKSEVLKCKWQLKNCCHPQNIGVGEIPTTTWDSFSSVQVEMETAIFNPASS